MKKRLIFTSLIAMVLGVLFAYPQAHALIPEQASDNISVSAMTIHGAKLYYYDQKSYTVNLDNLEIENMTLAKKSIVTLPPKTKIADIFADDETLYLLNADAKSILIYALDPEDKATKLPTLNLNGVKELAFKQLKQIAVNYLGYIYLLDSKGIYAFSKEGMFIAFKAISNPISMSLGQDQKLRILSSTKLDYRLIQYDMNLNTKTENPIKEKPQELKILDLAVNRWGELQLLNSAKSIYINKYSDALKALPDTRGGAKSPRREVLSFQNPTRIKCGKSGDYSLIAILDTKHNGIHIARENNTQNLTDLQLPSYGARVSLQKVGYKALDYYAAAGARFIIQQSSPIAKSFIRINEAGETEFKQASNKLKDKGVLDFSALAGFENDIYILDSKACKVHVFNAQTGEYINSFAGKGKDDNSFMQPVSIAVDKSGIIYILDSTLKKIALRKKGDGHAGNVNYYPVSIISLSAYKEKPKLLREQGDFLYCLFSEGSIIKIDKKSDKNKSKLDLGTLKIHTFDFVYDGDMAVLPQRSQNLTILTGPKYGVKAQYFSTRTDAPFPHFEQINNLRYDNDHNRLALMDSKAEGLRYLVFYPSMGDSPFPRMKLDEESIVTLKWEANNGIKNWIVKKSNNKEIIHYPVSAPEYICEVISPKPYSYSVRAIADDGKESSESPELIDFYSYANYLLQEKLFSEAINYYGYAQGILNDPKVEEKIVDCYKQMAIDYMAKTNYLEAHKALDRALELKPYLDLLETKCDIFVLEKRYQDALDYITKNISTYKDHKSLAKKYIDISYMAKKYDLMLEGIKDYRKKHGEESWLYEYEALAYKNTGKMELAKTAYENLNNLEPKFETELEIVSLEIELHNYYAADQRLATMQQKHAGKPQDKVKFLLGKVQYGQENWGRAQEFFGEAIRLNPNYADYYYHLAWAYYNASNTERAETNFARAYELSPQNLRFGMDYADILYNNKHNEAAHEALQTILVYVDQDNEYAEYYKLYTNVYRKLGRPEEALATAKLAQRYDPNDTSLHSIIEALDIEVGILKNELPPLQLLDLRVNPIYPALDTYYQKIPIGTVTLKNNRNESIKNIKISVNIAEVGKKREYQIHGVEAQSEERINIFADFSDKVFYYSGEKELSISAHYNYYNEDLTAHYKATRVQILPRGAMDWNYRRSLSAFINPSETYIKHFYNNIIRPVFSTESSAQPKNKNILEAIKIYSFYNANGFEYQYDPSTSNLKYSAQDNVSFPIETINSKSGDCEDFLVLLAATLECIGIPTALIDLPAGAKDSGHVMLAIDTAMNKNEISASGLEPDSFIIHNGIYWLPLEPTFLGQQDFIQAWLYAKRLYDASLGSASPAALIPFAEARADYPPSSFSIPYSSTWQLSDNSDNNAQEVRRRFGKEAHDLNNMGDQNIISAYINTLDKYPDNIIYRLRYAFDLWRMGKKTESEAQFNEVIKRAPDNFTANLHLGNICAEAARKDEAVAFYNKALLKADARQKDEIYCNLCILELKDFNKPAAKTYFDLMTDKIILKNRDSGYYSDLITY